MLPTKQTHGGQPIVQLSDSVSSYRLSINPGEFGGSWVASRSITDDSSAENPRFRWHNTLCQEKLVPEWTHVAAITGTSDGMNYSSLFVNGRRTGEFISNDVPLKPEHTMPVPHRLFLNSLVGIGGADFDGLIREVRVSEGIRYKSDFSPEWTLTTDEETLLLFHCTPEVDGVLIDSSKNGVHGTIHNAEFVSVGTDLKTIPLRTA